MQALPVLHSSLPYCSQAFPHHICKPFLFCIQADNIAKPFLIIFASLACFAFNPVLLQSSLSCFAFEPAFVSLSLKGQ
jgi:hypothetical protein